MGTEHVHTQVSRNFEPQDCIFGQFEALGYPVIDHEVPGLAGLVAAAGYLSPQQFPLLSFESAQTYGRGYLAWEEVRKGGRAQEILQITRLPATGTEGYFAGLGWMPEQIVAYMTRRGREMLDTATTLHRYDRAYRNKLIGNLSGEPLNVQAAPEAHAMFGAEIARMRALVWNSAQRPDAHVLNASFRLRTYERTAGLPPPHCILDGDVIRIRYALPKFAENGSTGGLVLGSAFSNSQLESYRVFAEMGRLGLPQVRASLHYMRT